MKHHAMTASWWLDRFRHPTWPDETYGLVPLQVPTGGASGQPVVVAGPDTA